MDYMRENCARTCGFCIVGDLSERPGEMLNEIMSSSGNGDTSAGTSATVSNMPKNMQQNVGKMTKLLDSKTFKKT